jgi:HAD superfamily hydrolase (TIGR01490 family)
MYEKSQKYKNLALFDFDGTLCTKDSFTGFIFYALSKRHIIKQGIKILPWIQAYYLKAYPAHLMRPKLFAAMFKNAEHAEIEAIAQQYSKHLKKHFNTKLLERLRQHQSLGDDVVIVSASVNVYLKFIADELNVDLICTNAEVLEHKLTGKFATKDCSSAEKAIRTKKEFDLDQYQNIYAYGNSDEDLEMLNLANYPYYIGKDNDLPFLEKIEQFA